MAGAITVGEGKGWSAASWAHNAVITHVAEALPENSESLREWLLQGVTEGGTGYLDLSTLVADDRVQVITAIHHAFRTAKERGPVGWQDPSFFESWLDSFQQLVEMTRKN